MYLFTGMIRCPCCGNTLKGTFTTYPSDRTKKYNGYRCNSARLRLCTYSHQLSARKIEKQLKDGIPEKMKQLILETEIRQAEKKTQPKVHDLVALTEQLRRLNNVYIAGNISDEDYAKETARIKSAIEKAKQAEAKDKPIDLSKLREPCNSDFIGAYELLTKEDQRRFWRSLLEEIYIEGNSVTGVTFRLKILPLWCTN